MGAFVVHDHLTLVGKIAVVVQVQINDAAVVAIGSEGIGSRTVFGHIEPALPQDGESFVFRDSRKRGGKVTIFNVCGLNCRAAGRDRHQIGNRVEKGITEGVVVGLGDQPLGFGDGHGIVNGGIVRTSDDVMDWIREIVSGA